MAQKNQSCFAEVSVNHHRRHAAVVTETPVLAPRTDGERVRAISKAFDDLLEGRQSALKEEVHQIVDALRPHLRGERRPALKSARFHRASSQLELLDPLLAQVRKVLAAEGPAAVRIEEVEGLLVRALRRTMNILLNEAQTIANDMEALAMRLQVDGHVAELEDVRPARWYQTAGQLEALNRLYSVFCTLTARTQTVVMAPEDQDIDCEDPGGSDTAAEDE